MGLEGLSWRHRLFSLSFQCRGKIISAQNGTPLPSGYCSRLGKGAQEDGFDFAGYVIPSSVAHGGGDLSSIPGSAERLLESRGHGFGIA
jgi:hypothetical protein